MNIVHAQYNGIRLIGGFQFWSNPQQAGTEQAIPVVLSRPTLLDLIRLASQYGCARLARENAELFRAGALSESIYSRNGRQLSAIAKARA